MKLTWMKLINYRGFAELNTCFDDDVTIFIGRNGEGKSTLLDAIAVMLSSYTGCFDFGKAHGIALSDARYSRSTDNFGDEQQFPVSIEMQMDCAGGVIPLKRELTGPKNKTTNKDIAELTILGKSHMEKVRAQEIFDLPVVAYYGTGRLWSVHKEIKRRKTISASRTMGYEDCLSSASNYKQMQSWVKNATFAVLQQEQMPEGQGENIKLQLAGVAKAVDSMLADQGWRNFHYSIVHDELSMTHKKLGTLPVSILSDGVRAMISLVADLAWRAVKLNPHLKEDAPAKSEGVVMIDEVDMHLHPQWQQVLVGSLRKTFPQIQFILTTHSPQVLSTVDYNCIRQYVETELSSGEKFIMGIKPYEQTMGVASADVMAQLQGVDPVPDVEPAHWLQKFKTLVAQDGLESSQAKALKEKLLSHFGETHPEWLECERIIRLQALKAKLPKRG
ncbi:MAG: AAA family ATPase [Alcanivorax sp.]|jgi:predicted ATP-binding protein involved in virulence